jgi:hypothetical protein
MRETCRGQAVLLYGASMGAAAVLKAVGDDNFHPAALILECPFDSLIGTVRHRFTSRGVPSFPLADLLVFWGGAQEGFNGFRYRPRIQHRACGCRLLMNGDQDEWVRVQRARAISMPRTEDPAAVRRCGPRLLPSPPTGGVEEGCGDSC